MPDHPPRRLRAIRQTRRASSSWRGALRTQGDHRRIAGNPLPGTITADARRALEGTLPKTFTLVRHELGAARRRLERPYRVQALCSFVVESHHAVLRKELLMTRGTLSVQKNKQASCQAIRGGGSIFLQRNGLVFLAFPPPRAVVALVLHAPSVHHRGSAARRRAPSEAHAVPVRSADF